MTAQGILGEVLPVGRRLCTPSSAQWLDGDAIDAGTAMILDSNLSQQARESLHHLGTALGPGVIYLGNVDSFANLLDQAAPTNAASPLQEISWKQFVSFAFGPFDLCGDRRTTDGNVMRNISARFDVNKGESESLTLYLCVTQGPGLPTPTTIVGSTSATYAGTGRTQQTLTAAIAPIGLGSRRSVQSPVEMTPYADLFVWVGWRGTNASDAVYSVSVYEVR